MRFWVCILLMGISFVCDSQSVFYSEDFSNDWKKGAITYGGVTPSQPTDGNWSWVNVGSPDNDGGSASSWDDMGFIDGAAVMSSTGSNSSTLAFRWNDVNNGNASNRVDWYSKVVIGAHSSVSISIDYAIGNGSSANSLYVYYILDGGTAVEFGSSVNKSSASGTFTVSALTCTTSVRLYAKAITRDYNLSYVLIDNITISGTEYGLPIELGEFGGYNAGDRNVIHWTTESEYNTSHFDIEKSVDGTYWKTITSVGAMGNSYVKVKYSIDDRELESEYNYYRLRQHDKDGYYELFSPILIMNQGLNKKTIVKYLTMNGQEIEVSGLDSYGVYIEVYDDNTMRKVYK